MSDTLLAIGYVERVEGEYVYIRTQRETGCQSCQSESSCGTSTLSRFFAQNSQLLRLRNRVNAVVGDRVQLAMEGSSLIKHAMLAYGVPLVGLFLGLFVTQSFSHELIGFSIAFLLMLLGWIGVKLFYQPIEPKILGRV